MTFLRLLFQYFLIFNLINLIRGAVFCKATEPSFVSVAEYNPDNVFDEKRAVNQSVSETTSIDNFLKVFTDSKTALDSDSEYFLMDLEEFFALTFDKDHDEEPALKAPITKLTNFTVATDLADEDDVISLARTKTSRKPINIEGSAAEPLNLVEDKFLPIKDAMKKHQNSTVVNCGCNIS